MKMRILVVLALTTALVLSFAGVATAKYAGYSANDAYLSWGGANTVESAIEGTTTVQASPHGGYTQTTVKCVVCHSIHRAFTTATTMQSSTDFKLLNGVGTGACAECHAAWGASPSDTLVAIGEVSSGPHIGNGGEGCAERGCHASVHGIGTNQDYAIIAKYNLQNPAVASSDITQTVPGLGVGSASDDLAAFMDEAIAQGNTTAGIGTAATGDAMKAYVTGYVCSPCHANSSFTIASPGFANPITLNSVSTVRSGHPSAAGQFYGHAPTCEKCHDLVDVASNSTAFPHADRGIDVYESRKSYDAYVPATTAYDDSPLLDPFAAIISTDNLDTTRYALWMTSSADETTTSASAIAGRLGEGGGFNLQDGVCLKCHDIDPGGLHTLP